MIKCYNVVGRFSDCATSGFTLMPATGTSPWTLELTGDLDQFVVLGVLCLKIPLLSLPGLPIPDHAPINVHIVNNSNTAVFRAVSIEYV